MILNVSNASGAYPSVTSSVAPPERSASSRTLPAMSHWSYWTPAVVPSSMTLNVSSLSSTRSPAIETCPRPTPVWNVTALPLAAMGPPYTPLATTKSPGLDTASMPSRIVSKESTPNSVAGPAPSGSAPAGVPAQLPSTNTGVL